MSSSDPSAWETQEIISWINRHVLLPDRDTETLHTLQLSGKDFITFSHADYCERGLTAEGAALLTHAVSAVLGSREPPPKPARHKRTEKLIGRTFVAKTSFFSDNEFELYLDEGDTLTVLEQDEYGWLKATSRNSNRSGWLHKSVIFPQDSELHTDVAQPLASSSLKSSLSQTELFELQSLGYSFNEEAYSSEKEVDSTSWHAVKPVQGVETDPSAFFARNRSESTITKCDTAPVQKDTRTDVINGLKKFSVTLRDLEIEESKKTTEGAAQDWKAKAPMAEKRPRDNQKKSEGGSSSPKSTFVLGGNRDQDSWPGTEKVVIKNRRQRRASLTSSRVGLIPVVGSEDRKGEPKATKREEGARLSILATALDLPSENSKVGSELSPRQKSKGLEEVPLRTSRCGTAPVVPPRKAPRLPKPSFQTPQPRKAATSSPKAHLKRTQKQQVLAEMMDRLSMVGKKGDVVYAKQAYNQARSMELSVEKGQSLIIIAISPNGWVNVEGKKGLTGWVPVSVIESSSKNRKQSLAHTPDKPLSGKLDETSHGDVETTGSAGKLEELLRRRPTIAQLQMTDILTDNDVENILGSCQGVDDRKKKRGFIPFRQQPSPGVFGSTIEAICAETHQVIPLIVQECIIYLSNKAMDRPGIFRVSGVFSDVAKLKSLFNDTRKPVCLMKLNPDPHAVATVLKTFFSELSEPCIPTAMYLPLTAFWVRYSTMQPHVKREKYRRIINLIPTSSRITLFVLLDFLVKMSKHADKNMMNARNLGIVFGPNIMWNKDAPSNGALPDLSLPAAIMEELILNYESIVKGSK